MDYTIGIYEKALPSELSWEDKLKIAKDNNYDFLEISIDETDEKLARLDWSESQKFELLTLSKKIGLPIRSMCLSGHRKYPLGSLDSAVRDRSLEIARKAIEFADFFGIRIIQLAGYDVYYEEGNEETKAFFIENLRKVAEMASAKGIILGFETMETEFMDTVEKTMGYVDLIGSPYLGIYPDCGNLNNASLKYGHDLEEDLEKGRGYIFAMHIKDTRPGLYRNLLFGEGQVDFERVLAIAKNLKVNRFVTEFWYQGAEDYLKDVREQNEKIRAILG